VRLVNNENLIVNLIDLKYMDFISQFKERCFKIDKASWHAVYKLRKVYNILINNINKLYLAVTKYGELYSSVICYLVQVGFDSY